MITKEIFEYLKELKATTDIPIEHEAFLPIRNKISIAAASNYALEDKYGEKFWSFLDDLIRRSLINNVQYVMDDLWTEEDEEDQVIEELFKNSEDSYLKYILFKSKLPESEIENKIVKILNEEFSAECFMNDEFGKSTWCITWD